MVKTNRKRILEVATNVEHADHSISFAKEGVPKYVRLRMTPTKLKLQPKQLVNWVIDELSLIHI